MKITPNQSPAPTQGTTCFFCGVRGGAARLNRWALQRETEMAKELLSEQELLEVINKELAKKWTHKDSYCRIVRLREASLPGRNWEIDTFSTGGNTLNYSKECDELRQNVLHEFVVKYDVRWLHEQ